MKLYNRTKVKDEIIEGVLSKAGRSVGARTNNVIVIVNSGKHHMMSHGYAHQADWVKRWFLAARHFKRNINGKREYKEGQVSTDCGYIHLTIPYTKKNPADKLDIAEDIFKLAAHEFRHIKDYQDNRFCKYNKKDWAKRHDNRPWEKVAIKAASKAIKKLSEVKQDSILALAVNLDELAR